MGGQAVTEVRFPNGDIIEAVIADGELEHLEQKLCVNCGGETPSGHLPAPSYIAVKCPACGCLHVGPAIQ
jgi:hypothetical protein